MGYRSPAIHRKCYEVDCQCKRRWFSDFRDAALHARSCKDARDIYYVSPAGEMLKVWTKDG